MLDTREYMDDCKRLGDAAAATTTASASSDAVTGVSCPLASCHYLHRVSFRSHEAAAASRLATARLYAAEFGEPLNGAVVDDEPLSLDFAVVASSTLGGVEFTVTLTHWQSLRTASSPRLADDALAREMDPARLGWLPPAVQLAVADRPAVRAKINMKLLAEEPALALREYQRYLTLVIGGLSGEGEGIDAAARELVPSAELARVERAALRGANAVLDEKIVEEEREPTQKKTAVHAAAAAAASSTMMQFTPSKTVDEIWHAHICSSLHYALFCRAVDSFSLEFSLETEAKTKASEDAYHASYLHHCPAYEEDHSVHVPAWRATLHAYRKQFGELPPASSWGAMGESGGCGGCGGCGGGLIFFGAMCVTVAKSFFSPLSLHSSFTHSLCPFHTLSSYVRTSRCSYGRCSSSSRNRDRQAERDRETAERQRRERELEMARNPTSRITIPRSLSAGQSFEIMLAGYTIILLFS